MKRAVALLLWAAGAMAQPLAPMPAPPDAGVTPAVGASLPLDLPFTDSAGRAVTLGDYFGKQPVLLVPGYYRCPQLCGLLMQGLLEGLHDSRLPPDAWRLVRVSIDPGETPADARTRAAVDLAYAHHLGGAATPPIEWLTGPPASLQALTQRLGIRTTGHAGDPDGIAHPAVAVVITPQGRVSGYLGGLRFEPAALQLALAQAAEGRLGGEATLADRIALLCAHFDPRLGRHSGAVLRGLQATGTVLVLALAGLFWRQRRAHP